MANIMILNGTSKKNGSTSRLIKAFTEGAVSAGNQAQEFYLRDMEIHGRLGCEGCSRGFEDEQLNLKAEAEVLRQEIETQEQQNQNLECSFRGSESTRNDRINALRSS